MNNSRIVRRLRGLGLSLLLGCLGFSFALATSNDGVGARGLSAEGRDIGTVFSRRATEFVTNTNLGVVVAGSQFTRQILVRFGFKPHLFSFGSQKPSSTITISTSGTLSGVKKDPGVEDFLVLCSDDIGGDILPTISKAFRLTSVPHEVEPLRRLEFVNDSVLPDAVANEPYSFTFHANGGLPSYEFFLFNDASFAAFPAGLALNTQTGVLFGKPSLPSGAPISFTLGLVDSTRLITSKTFTLNVLPGTISSELVATNGSFNLNFGKDGNKDSISLSIVINKSDLSKASVRSVADLDKVSFAMDIGGVSLPPRTPATGSGGGTQFPSKFDRSGSIRFPNLIANAVPAKGDDMQYEIKLNPRNGVLKIRFSNVDLIKAFGANFASFKDPVIPVNIKIGKPADDAITAAADPTGTTTTTTAAVGINFDRTDIVKFLYKRKGASGRGNAKANDKVAPGGLFLVTKVQGKFINEGTTKDTVVMRLSGFLRQPGGLPVTPKTGDLVGILLSTLPLGQFPASSLTAKGDVLSFANADRIAGLKTLIIDNKRGTFVVETFPLAPGSLFQQDIIESGEPLTVPLTMTIGAPNATTPTFDGQSSIPFFRKGSSLKNK